MDQLQQEEKQRQLEIKQNEELETKISNAEKERRNEEELAKTRASDLKKLQEEEAAQKLEAEKMEQEFLALTDEWNNCQLYLTFQVPSPTDGWNNSSQP